MLLSAGIILQIAIVAIPSVRADRRLKQIRLEQNRRSPFALPHRSPLPNAHLAPLAAGNGVNRHKRATAAKRQLPETASRASAPSVTPFTTNEYPEISPKGAK